jgi:tripartite-type tricarboxylate transporter receptor subunit TctC
VERRVFAPAKTPPAIVARLSKEIAAAMADPAVRQRMIELAPSRPTSGPTPSAASFTTRRRNGRAS